MESTDVSSKEYFRKIKRGGILYSSENSNNKCAKRLTLFRNGVV